MTFDSVLGVLILAIVPFTLAAYGGHLAAQALPSNRERRTAKAIFWGLCFIGVFITILYQARVTKLDQERDIKAARADEERQKKIDDAQRIAATAQAELKAIEQTNGQQIRWMQKRLDAAIVAAQARGTANAAETLRSDLSAMAQAIKQQSTVDAQKRMPSQAVTQTPAAESSSAKVCRPASLSECSDEQLLEWGKPLLEKISAVVDNHMAALAKLDDIEGSGWTGFFTGQDKDSKWLRAYDDAQQSTTDRFRDCCAGDSLAYHKELLQRVGGGLENVTLYEWIDDLLMPSNSKRLKQARKEGGSKVLDIKFNLQRLSFALDARVRTSRLH